jgi:hypothetical protein
MRAVCNHVTPSAEAITVRMHHSFVQLPDDNYKPRRYDIRSGYFGISYFDYSSPLSDPIEKMFIARHRLEKKDPSAAMSEAGKTYHLLFRQWHARTYPFRITGWCTLVEPGV